MTKNTNPRTVAIKQAKPKKQLEKVRRAAQRDRDFAAQIAAMYRKREMIPHGDDERPLDGDDLALVLESFAAEGTFVTPRHMRAFTRKIVLRWDMAKLRAQGKSYRDARLDVMVEHRVSESTVDRAVLSSRSGTRG